MSYLHQRQQTPERPQTPPQFSVPHAPVSQHNQWIRPLTTSEIWAMLAAFFFIGLIFWSILFALSLRTNTGASITPIPSPTVAAAPKHKQRDLPCAYYITFKSGEHYKSTFIDLDEYGRPTRAREKTSPTAIAAAKRQGVSPSGDSWYSFLYQNDRLVESVWYAGQYTWTTTFTYDSRGRLTEWERTGHGKKASQETFDRHDDLRPVHSKSVSIFILEYRYVLGQEGDAFWEKNGVVPGPEQSIVWGQTELWNAGALSDNDLGRRYTYDEARIAKIESLTSGMIFHPLYGKQCTAHEAAFPAR